MLFHCRWRILLCSSRHHRLIPECRMLSHNVLLPSRSQPWIPFFLFQGQSSGNHHFGQKSTIWIRKRYLLRLFRLHVRLRRLPSMPDRDASHPLCSLCCQDRHMLLGFSPHPQALHQHFLLPVLLWTVLCYMLWYFQGNRRNSFRSHLTGTQRCCGNCCLHLSRYLHRVHHCSPDRWLPHKESF